ncbi:collagen alpha-1(III) chain isoform X3 [Folsomia candida]|uniref:collagen alpha-1(III) chain isoform X3 n=1 Tax=Folsomia candida TaxID=158441 RepID=UPI000B8F8C68|nr:collagen alpha-1(III) chain isoform X3 [Folsomia candida]
MEHRKNPRKSPVAGGPQAKVSRKRNKNGISKVKEEKHPVGGPDPGGGTGNGPNSLGSLVNQYDPNSMDLPNLSHPQGNKGGLHDDMLMNGGDIKMENPPTPHQHSECPPDIPSLGDMGHDFPPDCKPAMGYGYPPYNNMPPGGDFGPPHPHGPMHGGPCGPPGPGGMGPGGPMNYPSGPPQMHPQQPHPPTKQQPNTLEAPYMQQQSQLFVFSTKLANKAAEEVIQHHYPSIIAFHTSQPATRKFLEVRVSDDWRETNYIGGDCQRKHPFKNNFGRQFQNSNWPGPAPPPSGGVGGKMKVSKGQQQQQQQQMSMPPNMGPGPPPPNMPPDFNQMPGQGGPPPGPWNTQNSSKPQNQGYPNYYDGPPYGGGPGNMGPCGQGPGGGPPPGYYSGHPNNMGPHGPMPPGIKVPDENLTPQQRMHREEQLAKMKRIQQLLLPENDPHSSHNVPGGDPNFHPMPPHENLDVYNMPGEPPPGHMDYGPGPGGGGNKHPGNEWSSPPSGFYMDGPQQGQGQPPGLKPPGMGPQGNGRPGKGGSIPSPATPLTPSSSCGGPPRPSPHSPMSGGDAMYPGGGGHSFYPSGYYSPQVGPGQEHSPSSAVQRKDSESSNSEGGKSRKEKSSCSISPNSSAPPSVKEANLMPVPSPQQIQYLNVFEGQELTIQKQPNVGLTDHNNEHSPGMSQDMNPSTPLGQQKPPTQPPTPVPLGSNQKSSDMNSGNSNAKNRPGSVGPITPKNNNNTTPNPSPRGLDSTSQPGTPQMNLDGMRNPSNSAGNTPNNSGMNNFGPGGPPPPGMNPNGGPPSQCNMMKQGLPPIGMDGPPDGPVFDNVPLNPNLSGPGPGPGPGKPAFDPISSMVQMSQQLTGGNGTPPNPSGNNMGSSNGNYGMHPPPGNTQLNHNMNVDGGIAMGGPQTVNNTYVNATMTIHQMNIQNIPSYMNPNPNMGPMNNQMGHMGPMGPQQMNHMPPIGSGPMGPMPGGPNSMNQGPNNMGPGGPGNSMGGPMGCGPMSMPPRGMGYPNQGPPPRMGPGPGGQGPPGGMGGGSMQGGPPGRGAPYRMPPNGPPNGPPRPFGGTNIQVKPNAPNTIQYLPARPPPPHNQGPSGMCSPGMGGPGNGPPGRSGPNLEFLQRYTNSSPGPVVNVNMGMNVNVGMGNRLQYPPGQMGNNGPMGNNGGPCGGPMRGPPPMMDQGHGGPMGGPGQQMPPQMMGGPPNGPGMKGGPPQGYPQGHNGPGPGGPIPSPSDPAYSQQFHHFQQQLYATGSNNGRNSMQSNMPPNPNTPPNQQFFNY